MVNQNSEPTRTQHPHGHHHHQRHQEDDEQMVALFFGQLHGIGSAADELHRGESAKEEHRRDAEGVQRQPTHREDRIVAGCRG